MTFTVQHKRSSTANRRPDPTALEDGQVAINTNNSTPGLFFRTSTGELAKAGPVTVSATQPTTPTNYTNFSVGELWVDSSDNSIKYWDGTAWINAGGALGDADFIPLTDCTYSLGSPTRRWANVHTCDLVMSNEGSTNEVDGTWGSYVIQEGEEDLFLLNRRNGKRYKFALQEVS